MVLGERSTEQNEYRKETNYLNLKHIQTTLLKKKQTKKTTCLRIYQTSVLVPIKVKEMECRLGLSEEQINTVYEEFV